MESIGWLALGGAAGLPEVRRRVIPVTKALGAAGLGIAGAVVDGGKGIIQAALSGRAPEEVQADSEPAPQKAPSSRPSRTARPRKPRRTT